MKNKKISELLKIVKSFDLNTKEYQFFLEEIVVEAIKKKKSQQKSKLQKYFEELGIDDYENQKQGGNIDLIFNFD